MLVEEKEYSIMKLGSIQNYSAVKNTPNFGALKIRPDELKDTQDAVDSMFPTVILKGAAKDAFKEIHQESKKLGQDCVITGTSPTNESRKASITIAPGDWYTGLEMGGVRKSEKPLAEMSLDLDNLPGRETILNKLENFKLMTIESMRAYRPVLDSYDSYKKLDLKV